jgi:hypothetical protein
MADFYVKETSRTNVNTESCLQRSPIVSDFRSVQNQAPVPRLYVG